MEECIICVTLFPENEFVIFECTHKVCMTCFSKLLQQNKPCPFCRAMIDNIPLLNIRETREIRETQETQETQTRIIIDDILEPQNEPISYRIGTFCCICSLPILLISTFVYSLKYTFN